jgi:hypothetical protein
MSLKRKAPRGQPWGSKGNTLEAKNYRSTSKQSSLKVVLGGGRGVKTPALRLAGLAPEGMHPGEYRVICETASLKQVGKAITAVLHHRVVDGPHTGTALKQWIPVSDETGVVSPTGRYAKYCAIALGRALDVDDPIGDPSAIFAGLVFLVQVGWRKTEKARGGKASDELGLTCKDSNDYLRAHEILCREEL